MSLTNKEKIAIFGIGGSLGRKIIPVLKNSGYDNVRVVSQRDELNFQKILEKGKGNVIARGHHYLERELVTDSMRGCKKVMLALPRYLTRHEILQYGKFIGECTAEANVPIIVRLAIFESSTSVQNPLILKDAFKVLDSYLKELNLEIVIIHSRSIVAGKWEDRRAQRLRQQESPTQSLKEHANIDSLIGWSITVTDQLDSLARRIEKTIRRNEIQN